MHEPARSRDGVLSVQDFQRLPEEPGRTELVRGWVVREPQPAPLHGRIVSCLGWTAGSREVWVVDPPSRTVAVHRRGGVSRVLHENDTLESGGVLRGFRVRVGEVFRV